MTEGRNAVAALCGCLSGLPGIEELKRGNGEEDWVTRRRGDGGSGTPEMEELKRRNGEEDWKRTRRRGDWASGTPEMEELKRRNGDHIFSFNLCNL